MATPTSKTESSTQTSPPLSILTPSATPTQIQNLHHHIFEKLTQESHRIYTMCYRSSPFLPKTTSLQ